LVCSENPHTSRLLDPTLDLDLKAREEEH
jgi:hypothetical protein